MIYTWGSEIINCTQKRAAKIGLSTVAFHQMSQEVALHKDLRVQVSPPTTQAPTLKPKPQVRFPTAQPPNQKPEDIRMEIQPLPTPEAGSKQQKNPEAGGKKKQSVRGRLNMDEESDQDGAAGEQAGKEDQEMKGYTETELLNYEESDQEDKKQSPTKARKGKEQDSPSKLTSKMNLTDQEPTTEENEQAVRETHKNTTLTAHHNMHTAHPNPHTVHPKPHITCPNPHTANPNPCIAQPEPRIAHHNPHTTHPSPHTAHPNPHTPHTKPHTAHHNPPTAHHSPSTPHPNPHTANPNPRTAKPNPHTADHNTHTTHSNPHPAHPNPHTPHPKPHTAHPNPHTTHPNPHTARPNLHTDHRKPHTAHPNPHTAHPNPHTTHPKPHTAHPNPHAAKPNPHTTDPKPHTDLKQGEAHPSTPNERTSGEWNRIIDREIPEDPGKPSSINIINAINIKYTTILDLIIIGLVIKTITTIRHGAKTTEGKTKMKRKAKATIEIIIIILLVGIQGTLIIIIGNLIEPKQHKQKKTRRAPKGWKMRMGRKEWEVQRMIRVIIKTIGKWRKTNENRRKREKKARTTIRARMRRAMNKIARRIMAAIITNRKVATIGLILLMLPKVEGTNSSTSAASEGTAAAAMIGAAIAANMLGGEDQEIPSQWEEEQGEIAERTEKERQREMAEQIERDTLEDGRTEEWIGINMNTRPSTVGMRVATQNANKKLYASQENREHVMKEMRRRQIDVMIVTEPGKGDNMNTTALKNYATRMQSRVECTTRGNNTNCGGIVIWMDAKWAGVPYKKHTLNNQELGDRLIALEFDNKKKGEHNKLLLIAYYGLNSATAAGNKEALTTMQGWVAERINQFKSKYKCAPVILAGDINAAKLTAIDTDKKREGMQLEEWIEKTEEDALVITQLEDMGLIDIIREKCPEDRIVTRKGVKGARRYLDKIMATHEAAMHSITAGGVMQGDILPDSAGESDHCLVIADFPVDTAGAASQSVGLWEPHQTTKWVTDEDELGKVDEEKVKMFNEKLEDTEPLYQDYEGVMEWYHSAAKGTILKKIVTRYPIKSKPIKYMQAEGWKIKSALGSIRKAVDQVGRQCKPIKETISKLVNRLTGNTWKAWTKEAVEKVETARQEDREGATEVLQEVEKEMQSKISREARNKKQKEIAKHTKLRNKRFEDKERKKLGRVINSIMKRASLQEEITRIDGKEGQPITETTKVAQAVTEFYKGWFQSRSEGRCRWMNERDMYNMDLDGLLNQEDREFVEQAYGETYRKYSTLQKEEGIWNGVWEPIDTDALEATIKQMKAGTAGGPSGMTYDVLKAIDRQHLEPMRKVLQKCMDTREIPTEMNRTKLRPLPKTEAGMADLSKTRPIALMEVMLKVYERIIFGRIIKVINKYKMLRSEQYGSLPGRSVGDPIRCLAEAVEDAVVTGKELHVFSADLAKAFDTIEYWSQSMSWTALGMPKEMSEMLTNMDKGGTTEVNIGQGRTTSTVLGEEGWYSNGRGVRQGSIGGPIKWVVFMNFWLEYIHNRNKGQGYKMDKGREGEELLGQMFVDDSNWIANSAGNMTELIEGCEKFVNFHTLSFNKSKCEYMVVNQKKDQRGEWEVPNWGDGTKVKEDLRKVKDSEQWKAEKREMTQAAEEIQASAGYERGEQVTKWLGEEEQQQLIEAFERIAKCKDEGEYKEQRGELKEALVNARTTTHGRGEWEEGVEDTVVEWEEAKERERDLERGLEGKAMKYLGVHFQVGKGWGVQRRVIESKFRKLNDDISRSAPTRAQAIYCINAVIAATLKYPLQVAGIPKTTLERWDRRHRACVRKAGKLPKMPVWAFHEETEKGGLGLQSMVQAVDRTLITNQAVMLNKNTVVGAMTRAGNKRREEGIEPDWTVQARTREAIIRHGMKIEKEEDTDFFGRETIRYKGTAKQGKIDQERAEANARTSETWEAYGDGATWKEDQRAGWGLCIGNTGQEKGDYKKEKCGRVQGAQENSTAETTAILEALLAVHPSEGIVIYSDNQGCVERAKMKQSSAEKWNNRALWMRIKGLWKYRESRGGDTEVVWVHSHVDDEERQDTSKAKYVCPCKQNSEERCNPSHRVHRGNQRADELAKEGAAHSRETGWEKGVEGELSHLIRKGQEACGGPIPPWVKENLTPHYQTPGTWKEACEASDDKLRKGMLQGLDNKGKTTWRFWARMMTNMLPTMARIAKYAREGGDNNLYRKVYGGHIGEKGKCVMEGCTEEEESIIHALRGCNQPGLLWEKVSQELKESWGEGEEGRDTWEGMDWMTNPPEGWREEWTIWGLVPKGVGESLTRMERKRMKQNVGKIVDTASRAWKNRNEGIKQWEKENEELSKEKKEANKKGWRANPRGTKKKRGRPKQEAEGDEQMDDSKMGIAKQLKKQKEEQLENRVRKETKRKVENENGRRKKEKRPPVTEAQKRKMEQECRREQMKRHRGEINDPVSKEKARAGTEELQRDNQNDTSMWDTMAMNNSEKQSHVWCPKTGTKVKVWWAGKEGKEKLNSERGKWENGTIVCQEWEENQGAPTVWIRYKGWGDYKHSAMHMGSLIKPVKSPERKRGKPPGDTLLSKEAMEWIGQGAELEVKRGAQWYRGVVIGRTSEGIEVRYPKVTKRRAKGIKRPPARKGDGETIIHEDLHTRGCRVIKMRRWAQQDTTMEEEEEKRDGKRERAEEEEKVNEEVREAMGITEGDRRREDKKPSKKKRRQGERGETPPSTHHENEDETSGDDVVVIEDGGIEDEMSHLLKWGTEEEILKKTMKVRRSVAGNGHCAFSAIATQTSEMGEGWRGVREEMAKWIRNNWEKVAQDTERRGVTKQQLLDRVEFYGDTAPINHWGDEAVMWTAAAMIGKRITVIRPRGTNLVFNPNKSPSTGESEMIIIYNGRDHYDATKRNEEERERGKNKGKKAERPEGGDGEEAGGGGEEQREVEGNILGERDPHEDLSDWMATTDDEESEEESEEQKERRGKRGREVTVGKGDGEHTNKKGKGTENEQEATDNRNQENGSTGEGERLPGTQRDSPAEDSAWWLAQWNAIACGPESIHSGWTTRQQQEQGRIARKRLMQVAAQGERQPKRARKAEAALAAAGSMMNTEGTGKDGDRENEQQREDKRGTKRNRDPPGGSQQGSGGGDQQRRTGGTMTEGNWIEDKRPRKKKKKIYLGEGIT